MSDVTVQDGETGVVTVAVIGGGLAGMSAAEAIARHFGGSTRVILLESKRVTGGRAGSFFDPRSQTSVDYCQHVAMGCCTNLLGLLRRCQLDHLLSRHESLTFLHPTAEPSRMTSSQRLPAPFHLASAIGAMRFLDRRQRKQVRRGMLGLMRTSERELRGTVAGNWLRQHRQDDDTIGEFWGIFSVSALGEEIDRVDMSALRKVMMDGFAAARGSSDVLVPKIPLVELFGQELPEKLRDLGVEIRTGQTVDLVEADEGKGRLQTSSGEWVLADHVVAALPWHGLGKLFADDIGGVPFQRFAEIPSSAITGIHLWLDREITEVPLVALVGTVAQWLFHPPWPAARSGGREGHYYQVVVSAANKWLGMDRESLVELVMSDLRCVLPQVEQARLLHSRVVSDPHSVFSIRPEVVDIRPSTSTALPWLHLAGDWIDTGWPATMESAVISGRMAANSIAQQQGWDAVAIDPGLPRGILARTLIQA